MQKKQTNNNKIIHKIHVDTKRKKKKTRTQKKHTHGTHQTHTKHFTFRIVAFYLRIFACQIKTQHVFQFTFYVQHRQIDELYFKAKKISNESVCVCFKRALLSIVDYKCGRNAIIIMNHVGHIYDT